MKVELTVPEIPLGNNGITLKIKSPDGKHTGDLQIGRAKVIWRKSRQRTKGKVLPITKLIDWLEQHADDEKS